MVFRDGSGPAMARSARRSAYLTGQTISNAAWRWSPASSGVGYSDASYTANRLDQYASVTGAVMNYDLNGNLVCTSGPVACAARGDDFIYSAENQLLRAYGPDADYSYGPAARRVRKDVAGVVTDFLHAGDMEIAEYGASGTLLRRYIPGPGVDQRIAMIECGAGGGAAACAPGGAGVATRYYFADRQGNVLALANQDGTLAQQFFYTPFGVELVGNAGENPFRYTGRRFDPETGLYYYRARYYDADLGRFLQVDPVGYADQWNLYAYVGNNPLNATDPTGMCANVDGVTVCPEGGQDGDGSVRVSGNENTTPEEMSAISSYIDDVTSGIANSDSSTPLNEQFQEALANAKSVAVEFGDGPQGPSTNDDGHITLRIENGRLSPSGSASQGRIGGNQMRHLVGHEINHSSTVDTQRMSSARDAQNGLYTPRNRSSQTGRAERDNDTETHDFLKNNNIYDGYMPRHFVGYR